eukprot:364431-Chlamydomonas_euryale.AAC.4
MCYWVNTLALSSEHATQSSKLTARRASRRATATGSTHSRSAASMRCVPARLTTLARLPRTPRQRRHKRSHGPLALRGGRCGGRVWRAGMEGGDHIGPLPDGQGGSGTRRQPRSMLGGRKWDNGLAEGQSGEVKEGELKGGGHEAGGRIG